MIKSIIPSQKTKTMTNTCSKFFHILLAFLILISFPSPSLSEKCHQSDKRTLLKIKNALKNNNPYFLANWTPDTDCCQWYGIECDERTHRVTTLAISQENLNLRPIPANEIAKLTYLDALTFHHTNLSGPIPPDLAKLTHLRFLDLRWNHLTGPVPEFFSQLKNLDYIGLSFNNLTGSIPPSLSQLPKLTGLLLDRNQLTGPIPESFGEFQGKPLIYLYMSHNQLSGRIPSNLGNASFYYMDLSRNKLEGDISFMLGRNKTMGTVYLSRNLLEFNFSNFEFPQGLQNLDLNHNKIYGNLPQDLTNYNYLSALNVSYNRLCGKIPVGGRMQEYDTTVYFHNRCLCGAPLLDCKK